MILGTLKKWFNRKRPEKGQGMVEFALALPIILLLFFGVIEFGRLFAAYSAVFSASREAVRYGAAVGQSENGVPYYMDCAGIRAAAVRIGIFAGVTEDEVDIRYDNGPQEALAWDDYPACPAEVDLGNRIVVRVTTNFTPILPIINLPVIPISSTAARTIIRNVDIFGTPLPSPTLKHTYTQTVTGTITRTITISPTITETFVHSRTPTSTWTPLPTFTGTLPPTSTATHTPTGSPTATPTVTSTATETSTPTVTNTPTNTGTPTWTPTPTKCQTPVELGGCKIKKPKDK